jgi:hypothetical protein
VSEDARLALVRELERADEEVAALLTELDELFARVETLRRRALELEAFFARLPAERTAAGRAVQETQRAAAEADETAARAAAELGAAEASGKDERIAAARRFEIRARDAASTAARLASEARAAAASLEERAAGSEQEAAGLGEEARELAAALRERPGLATEAGLDLGAGLAGVSKWAAQARAALLVARTALAADRDAVIRQANELGSLVLGEPLGATAAAAVARRLERELGS